MLSRFVEDGLELLRRVPHLRGVETDPDDPLPVRQRAVQGLHRFFGAEVSEETHYQGRGDAKPLPGVEHGVVYTHDHRLEGHPSAGVGLRIEEHLDTAHVLGGGFLQVGPGQIVEVLFMEEHLGSLVINVQEGLEVAEVVGPAHIFHGGVTEGDLVTFGEREHQLGLQGTLDMDVQLRLLHSLDKSLRSFGAQAHLSLLSPRLLEDILPEGSWMTCRYPKASLCSKMRSSSFLSRSEAVLTSSGRSEGVSVVVAGPREPEGPDRGGTGGTRELPDARVRASVRTLLLGAGSHLRGDSRSCADSRGSGDHRLREASARRPEARQGPIPGLILRFTRARGAKGPSLPRRKLPELPRWPLLIGKSGSRSPRVPEVDQQDDEERRAYDIYVEHHSYVTRIVVTCAHHLADVDRGGAQEPDGGCDHGRNPEVAPDPVRQDPQGAGSEVRNSHLGLERVA